MNEKYSYYCGVLGINTDATKDEIKKAYHELVKIYHPDTNRFTNSDDKFKLIRDAYDYLIEHFNKNNENEDFSVWIPYENEDGEFVDFYDFYDVEYYEYNSFIEIKEIAWKAYQKTISDHCSDEHIKMYKKLYDATRIIDSNKDYLDKYWFILGMFIDIDLHIFSAYDVLGIDKKASTNEIKAEINSYLELTGESPTTYSIIRNYCNQAINILLNQKERKKYDAYLKELKDKVEEEQKWMRREDIKHNISIGIYIFLGILGGVILSIVIPIIIYARN